MSAKPISHAFANEPHICRPTLALPLIEHLPHKLSYLPPIADPFSKTDVLRHSLNSEFDRRLKPSDSTHPSSAVHRFHKQPLLVIRHLLSFLDAGISGHQVFDMNKQLLSYDRGVIALKNLLSVWRIPHNIQFHTQDKTKTCVKNPHKWPLLVTLVGLDEPITLLTKPAHHCACLLPLQGVLQLFPCLNLSNYNIAG